MRRSHLLVLTVVLGASAAACTSNDSSSDDAIAVSSTADACTVATNEAPAGTIEFAVTNDGEEATEFYLYGDDGVTVVGEVENIGPGITRNMVVDVAAGSYFTACKPGMVGDGIRAEFTVTGES
jgi:iron uptake system component EfeO